VRLVKKGQVNAESEKHDNCRKKEKIPAKGIFKFKSMRQFQLSGMEQIKENWKDKK
jgi:hypothetical protein